jgi:DNA helicase-2/ATP-dependent DNA helicase PcrA
MNAPSPAAAYLADLNDAQRTAVLADDAPLLIVAGAGTGKTRTLVHRTARLIADGADPSRILLLTFTRRSAAEMLRRVEELIAITETTKASSSCETVSSNREVAATSQAAADAPNPPDLADRMAAARKRQQGGVSKKVWGGTFHAVASRGCCAMYARPLGLAPDFVIHDRSDSEDLLDVVRTGLGLSKKNKRFPKKRTCLAIYSHCVNAQRQLSDVLKQHYPWCEDFADD